MGTKKNHCAHLTYPRSIGLLSGILSGSQHGSSSNCPPFELVPLCLYVCVLVFHGFSLSFVSCTPIFSLVGPVWAPARPLSPPSLGSLHLFFLFSFLSFFILVSPCHFVLDLSLPLASLCAFSQFSPFCGQPGHAVRLVTPLYSTYYLFLLRFSPPASLPFLPSFISFPLLKVFAQSGFAHCGNTL